MTQFWIIEADSVQELEVEIYQELEVGSRLEGSAYLSPGRKYYQAITRHVSVAPHLEIPGLTNLESFLID